MRVVTMSHDASRTRFADNLFRMLRLLWILINPGGTAFSETGWVFSQYIYFLQTYQNRSINTSVHPRCVYFLLNSASIYPNFQSLFSPTCFSYASQYITRYEKQEEGRYRSNLRLGSNCYTWAEVIVLMFFGGFLFFSQVSSGTTCTFLPWPETPGRSGRSAGSSSSTRLSTSWSVPTSARSSQVHERSSAQLASLRISAPIYHLKYAFYSLREVRHRGSVVLPRDAVVLGRHVRLQQKKAEESRQRTPLLQHDAGEPGERQRQKQRCEKSPVNAPFRKVSELDDLSDVC